MKDYFFVSCDGDLFDTRKPNWHSLPPLRRDYGLIKRDHIDSIALRAAIRACYAWPGGYDLIAITSDGGCLCMDCCRKNYYQLAWSMRHKCSDGWLVEGIDAACNFDDRTFCDHCGKTLVEGWEEEE